MGQIVVRNLDDAVLVRLKQKAAERKVSLERLVREVLTATAKPSRSEVTEMLDAFRARVGPVPRDSTAVIREMRDNGWRGD